MMKRNIRSAVKQRAEQSLAQLISLDFGARTLVVGAGPSIRGIPDLNFQQDATIFLNHAVELAGKDFKTGDKFLFMSDINRIRELSNHSFPHEKRVITLNQLDQTSLDLIHEQNIFVLPRLRHSLGGVRASHRSLISTNLRKGVYLSGGSVLFFALQVLLVSGVKEILLAGVDLSMSSESVGVFGEKPHWNSYNFATHSLPVIEIVQEIALSRGVKIRAVGSSALVSKVPLWGGE